MCDKGSKVLTAKEVVGIRPLPVRFFQLCCMVEIVHNKVLEKMLPWERGPNPQEHERVTASRILSLPKFHF